METSIVDYNELLQQAVAEIENARFALARQVSSSISSIHWCLGKLLSEKKVESKYGGGVVKRLSKDLEMQYPNMGLSPRNLWNMKRFYDRYKGEDTKLLQAVAVLPWGHNLLLLDKQLNSQQVAFYAREVADKGWSREMLLDRIEKADDEEASIGLILCAEKDHLEVEVALQDIGKPIGVAEYQYLLPKDDLMKVVSAEMKKL
jgi:predicted nuclease of restriction endonuclease-like (RecB) superfamily